MYIVYSNSHHLPVLRKVSYDENQYRKITEDESKISIVLPENYYEEIFQELEDDFKE